MKVFPKKLINKLHCITLITIMSICLAPLSMAKTKQPSLSQSVKWHQQSKEYALLTSSLYNQAAENLREQKTPNENWVVVMDVDETLLDNSPYQAELDKSGKIFTVVSWNKWIKAKKAQPIYGAKNFVETVLAKGGKLVLITNRPKILDKFTWENLQIAGFPINNNNACLVGRSREDKIAVDHITTMNDKDRRRQLAEKGALECFSTDKELPSVWKDPAKIVMQVGDNIEDIYHVTQEDANVPALLERQGKDILILPNAMYGSW